MIAVANDNKIPNFPVLNSSIVVNNSYNYNYYNFYLLFFFNTDLIKDNQID